MIILYIRQIQNLILNIKLSLKVAQWVSESADKEYFPLRLFWIIKIIKIESCQTCPYEGKCEAYKSLTRKQRVMLSIGNNTPTDFILAKCHLADEVNSDD